MRHTLPISILILCIVFASAEAATRYVPGGYSTVQAAINACNNSDVVIVSDGTYTGPGNQDIDFLGKTITVRSQNGPDGCIINCQNSGRGFYFHMGETNATVVEGFRIVNGNVSAYRYPNNEGGGILCTKSSPLISKCTIENCIANAGGGISSENYGVSSPGPKILNCRIAGNSDYGIRLLYSDAIINDCVITENAYAGIVSETSSVIITDASISENDGFGHWGYDDSSTFVGCTISGNSDCGMSFMFCQSATIINCVISDNSTSSQGGGVYFEGPYITSPIIANSLIHGNYASERGGGIFLGRFNNIPPVQIVNSTIVRNSADEGGGIYCASDKGWSNNMMTISNSVIWDNTAISGEEVMLGAFIDNYPPHIAVLTVTHSDVRGGENAVYIEEGSILNWGGGNIDNDPLFQDPAADNYHLTSSSPCINSGDNGAVPPDVADIDEDGDTIEMIPFDLDGNPRISGSAVDMGAYEGEGLQCPPLPPHEPWSFVHITDSHIGFPGAREYIASAFDAITQLNPKPDFVLNTGDIVDSSWLKIASTTVARKVYENYLEALEPLEDSGIEHYEVPGNHDRYVYGYFLPPIFPWDWIPDYFYSQDLSLYGSYLEGDTDYSFEPEGKGFIFYGMNSGKDVAEGVHIEPLVNPPAPEELRGTGLTSEQMEELCKLDACKPKVVFMHHPAVHTEEGHVIANNRDGPGGFIEYCKKNNVQLVLTGHTHQDHILDADGTNIAPGTTLYPQFIQTPSVSNPTAWFQSDDPGYRVVDVVDNKCYVRAYSHLSPSDLINIKLNTHANLHVYDTMDRHVGITASGQHERDIPRSFYFSPIITVDGIKVLPEEIIILNPINDYRYEIFGVETGNYRLNITSKSGGEAFTFEAIDIPTASGSRHVYAVDWQALSVGEEGVVLEIDADGDGVFERTVIADEDLTGEEFALQTKTVIDFKPDVLNLRSPGKFITVYIELPEGFDVSNIDVSTLKLNDTIYASSAPISAGDYDEDGIADLMVKLERQQVIELLGSGTQMVTLTGRLSDGRPFAGIDFVRVIDGTETEAAETESESIVTQESVADMEGKLQTRSDDSVNTTGKDAYDVKEAVGFILFEAGEIIKELNQESFNSEESAFELECAINDLFTMLDEGMYFESLILLENDILQRMDGCANIGKPDEDDWITSIEVQALIYPLVIETIELLESLL